jgi:hypothetical protein
MNYFSVLIFPLIVLFSLSGHANTTMHTIEVVEQALHKLTWDAPRERENGDALLPEEILGYRVMRSDDAGNVLETVELDAATTELAITIVPDTCMVYTATAIATDGSPVTDEGSPGTLESVPTDQIRICIIPPKRPRNFQVQ